MTYLCERLAGREVDIRCTLAIPAHELGKGMAGVRLCKCGERVPDRPATDEEFQAWADELCGVTPEMRAATDEEAPNPDYQPGHSLSHEQAMEIMTRGWAKPDDRDPHTTADDAAITVAADQARQEAKALASFDERVAAWRRKPTELLWDEVVTAKRAYAAEFLETMMMRAGALE